MYSDLYIIHPVTWNNSIPATGTPVLSYSITYPRFCPKEPDAAFDKINHFYVERAKAFQSELKADVANYLHDEYLPPPLYTYEAVMSYEVPFCSEQIASIFTNQYKYLGGAHGSTTRFSETWNLNNGEQIYLSAYFPDYPAVIDHIIAQIQQQIQNGNNIYFDNYIELVPQYFRPQNFYLTPGGVVIYFQQYDIGPYVSGIIEFKLLLPNAF